MRTLIAGAALALLLSGQALAAEQRFDLVCTATDEAGDKVSEHFSVDLPKQAWCSRAEGRCAVATLFGIEGDVVVFERSELDTASYDHWANRKTGEYRSWVSIEVPRMETESRGACKEAPFTDFGVEGLNDADKAARS
jgi:hypothetical protein